LAIVMAYGESLLENKNMAKSSKKKDSDKDKSSSTQTVKGGRVKQLLKKAHENGATVELQINMGSQIHYTTFSDEPPPEPTEEEGKDSKVSKKSSSATFSHLDKMSYLLLAQLVPEDGKEKAKKGKSALLRFYDGKKAVEGKVVIKKIVNTSGTLLLEVAFPKKLKIHEQRRHYRANVIPEIDLRILNPIEARVIDMSVQGLAFCLPAGEKVENGTKVEVKLKIPPTLEVQERLELDSGLVMERSNHENVEFGGFIRNIVPLPGENKVCPAGSLQCGVQFDITSATRSLEVGEVYGYVEREYLRSVAKRKPKKEKKLNSLLSSGAKQSKLWNKIMGKLF
jgi:hypothetical protein